MSRGAGGEHCGAATGCVVTKIVANFGPGPTPESGDSVWGQSQWMWRLLV